MSKFWKVVFIINLFLVVSCGDSKDSVLDEPDEDVIQPVIISFSLNETSIQEGQSTTLNWQTTGADEVFIFPDIGLVDAEGSLVVNPHQTITYTLLLISHSETDNSDNSESITLEVITQLQEPEIPVDDECENVTAESLKNSLTLEASSTYIYRGEEIEVKWDVPYLSAQSSLMSDEALFSEALQGLEIDMTDFDTSYTLNVNYCDISTSKTLNIHVYEWEKMSHKNVTTFYQDADNNIWLGKTDGALYKSFDYGQSFNQQRENYIGIVNGKEYQADKSEITGLFKMEKDCNNAIIIGTKAGNLYRSFDEGITSENTQGEDTSIAYFSTSSEQPLKNPSSITFIIKDPKNKKGGYIGHKAGLTHFENCMDEVKNKSAFKNVTEKNSNHHFKNATFGTVFQNRIYVVELGQLFSSEDGIDWVLENELQNIIWINSTKDSLVVANANAVYFYDGNSFKNFSQTSSTSGIDFNGMKLIATKNSLELSRDDGISWTKIQTPLSAINSINANEGFFWMTDNQNEFYRIKNQSRYSIKKVGSGNEEE